MCYPIGTRREDEDAIMDLAFRWSSVCPKADALRSSPREDWQGWSDTVGTRCGLDDQTH